MDDNTAALMRFQSETNGRMAEFSTAISKLSDTVSNLAGSIQAQIASSVGFKELYEMQVKNLERADSSIKDLLAAKISAVERIEKIVEKVQSDLHTMKPFSQTVTALGSRVAALEAVAPATLADRIMALETRNLTLRSKLNGATAAAKALWFIGYAIFTATVSAVTWYFAHFH